MKSKTHSRLAPFLCAAVLSFGLYAPTLAVPANAAPQSVSNVVEGVSSAAKAKKSKAKKTAAKKAKAKKAKKAKAKKTAAKKAKAAKAKKEKSIEALLRAKTTPTMTKAQAVEISKRKAKPVSVVRYKHEPSTLKAWQKLFYDLPTTQWGGGDVSVSVRLTSGRRLWVYGDTLSSENGFVNSSAIVTSGKSIRVANQGAAILPAHAIKNGRKTVYWTETVTPLQGEYASIVTTVISVEVGGGLFDFKRIKKKSRKALVHVDMYGNVNFVSWVGYVNRPNIGTDGDDFRNPRPGYFTYGAYVHPIKLKNGKYLRTRNRNYTKLQYNDDGTFRYEAWRPTFELSNSRVNPYWGR